MLANFTRGAGFFLRETAWHVCVFSFFFLFDECRDGGADMKAKHYNNPTDGKAWMPCNGNHIIL